MPLIAKILLGGFVLFMALLGLGLCKVSGYWSRIEEKRDLERYYKMEFKDREYHD